MIVIEAVEGSVDVFLCEEKAEVVDCHFEGRHFGCEIYDCWINVLNYVFRTWQLERTAETIKIINEAQ